MNGKPVAGNSDQDGLFASAVFEKEDNSIIVKIVNTGDQAQAVNLNFDGLNSVSSAEVTTFNSPELTAENTLDEPEKITPKTEKVEIKGVGKKSTAFAYSIPARTFAMLKIKK